MRRDTLLATLALLCLPTHAKPLVCTDTPEANLGHAAQQTVWVTNTIVVCPDPCDPDGGLLTISTGTSPTAGNGGQVNTAHVNPNALPQTAVASIEALPKTELSSGQSPVQFATTVQLAEAIITSSAGRPIASSYLVESILSVTAAVPITTSQLIATVVASNTTIKPVTSTFITQTIASSTVSGNTILPFTSNLATNSVFSSSIALPFSTSRLVETVITSTGFQATTSAFLSATILFTSDAQILTNTVVSVTPTSTSTGASLPSDVATDPTCPVDQGKRYIAGLATYRILCNTDVAPGANGAIYTDVITLKDCLDLCAAFSLANPNRPCVAGLLFGQICYTKTSLGNGPFVSPGGSLGVLVDAEPENTSDPNADSATTLPTDATIVAPTASATPSSGTNFPSCPFDDGKLYSSAKIDYLVYCESDIAPEADIATLSDVGSLKACLDFCSDYSTTNPTRPCEATLLVGTTCFIKSSRGQGPFPAAGHAVGVVRPKSSSSSSNSGSASISVTSASLVTTQTSGAAMSTVPTSAITTVTSSSSTTDALPSGFVKSPMCPRDDGKMCVIVNGELQVKRALGRADTYKISCQSDIAPGQDGSKTEGVDSILGCLEICTEYSNTNPDVPCLAALLVGTTCYTKLSVGTGPFLSDGHVVGLLVTPVTTSATYLLTEASSLTSVAFSDLLSVSSFPAITALSSISGLASSVITPTSAATATESSTLTSAQASTAGISSVMEGPSSIIPMITSSTSETGALPSGFVKSPMCPRDDGKMCVIVNGELQVKRAIGHADTYMISCRSDIAPGQDGSTTEGVESILECLQICTDYSNVNNDAPCVASLLVGTTCYTKLSVGSGPYPSDDHVVGLLVVPHIPSTTVMASIATSTITTSTSTTAVTSSPVFVFAPSCPADDKKLYKQDGKTYEIRCDSDFASGQDGEVDAAISTIKDCLDRCSAYSLENPSQPCLAGVVIDGECHIKITAGTGTVSVPGHALGVLIDSEEVSSSTIIAAISSNISVSPTAAASLTVSSISASPTASATFPSCPSDDGKTYSEGAQSYRISCSSDVAPGADAEVILEVESLQQCLAICSLYSEANPQQPCLAGMLTGTACYVKNSLGNGPFDSPDHAIGVVISQSLTTSSNIATITASSNALLSLSLSSPTLPAAESGTNESNSASSTVPSTSLPSITSIPPSCPADDNQTFLSSSDAYQIYCESNIAPGADGSTTKDVATLRQCLAICSFYSIRNPSQPCLAALLEGTICFTKISRGSGPFASAGHIVGLVVHSITSSSSSTRLTPSTTNVDTELSTLSPSTSTSSAVSLLPPAPSASFPSCPDDDGKSYINNNDAYQISCDADIAPDQDGGTTNGISSLKQCLDICTVYTVANPSARCVAAVLVGTTCYTKTSQGTGKFFSRGHALGLALLPATPSSAISSPDVSSSTSSISIETFAIGSSDLVSSSIPSLSLTSDLSSVSSTNSAFVDNTITTVDDKSSSINLSTTVSPVLSTSGSSSASSLDSVAVDITTTAAESSPMLTDVSTAVEPSTLPLSSTSDLSSSSAIEIPATDTETLSTTVVLSTTVYSSSITGSISANIVTATTSSPNNGITFTGGITTSTSSSVSVSFTSADEFTASFSTSQFTDPTSADIVTTITSSSVGDGVTSISGTIASTSSTAGNELTSTEETTTPSISVGSSGSISTDATTTPTSSPAGDLSTSDDIVTAFTSSSVGEVTTSIDEITTPSSSLVADSASSTVNSPLVTFFTSDFSSSSDASSSSSSYIDVSLTTTPLGTESPSASSPITQDVGLTTTDAPTSSLMQTTPSSETSSAVTPTTSALFPSCPLDDGQTFDNTIDNYKIYCESDIAPDANGSVSMDVTSLRQCLSICSVYSLDNPSQPCLAALLVGTTCYTKSAYGNGPFTSNGRSLGLLIPPSSSSVSPTPTVSIVATSSDISMTITLLSSTPPTAAAMFPSCPQDDGKRYQTDQATYQVYCESEVDSVMSSSTTVGVQSLKECLDICAAFSAQNPTNLCLAASLFGTTCSTKSFLGSGPVAAAGHSLGVLVFPETISMSSTISSTISNTATASTAPVFPTCPEDDGSIYVNGASRYDIYCDFDVGPGDDSSTTEGVSSLMQCLDICASYSIQNPNVPCLAGVLVATTCYTKSSQGTGPFSSNGHSLGLLINPPVPTISTSATVISSIATAPSTTTSATPSATAVFPTCPLDNGSTFTSGADSYQIYCDSDIAIGADSSSVQGIQSLNDCLDICASYTLAFPDNPCLAGVLVGATCYTKASQGAGPFASTGHSLGLLLNPPTTIASTSITIVTTTSITSSATSTVTPSTTANFPSCPQDNGSTLTSGADTFRIFCDSDIAPDADITHFQGIESLNDCLEICASFTQVFPETPCLAGVLVDTTCFVKSSQGSGPFAAPGHALGILVSPTSTATSTISDTLSTSASVAEPTSLEISATLSSSTEIAPTATAVFPTCPQDAGSTFTSGADTYLIYCDSDIATGFESSSFTGVRNLNDCLDICASYTLAYPDNPCLAGVLVGTICYTKSSQGTGPFDSAGRSLGLLLNPPTVVTSTSLTMSSTSSTAPSATTTLVFPSCPRDDASTYVDGEFSYTIYCEADTATEASLSVTEDVESLKDCLDICGAYTAANPDTPCLAGVLFGKTCETRSSQGTGPFISAGHSLGLLVLPPITSSSSSSSTIISSAEVISSSESTSLIVSSTISSTALPSVTAAFPNCPRDDGKTYTAGEDSYLVYCEADIASGADSSTSVGVQTLKDCLDICTAYTLANPEMPCLAGVLTGTTCYTKSSQGTGPFLSAVHSLGLLILPTQTSSVSTTAISSSTFTASPSASVFPTCPQDNGNTYISGAASFVVYCDANIAPGADSSTTQGVQNLNDCLDICASHTLAFPDDPCLAGVLVGTTCYTKSSQDTKPINTVGYSLGLLIITPSTSSSTQSTVATSTTSVAPLATAVFPFCPRDAGSTYASGTDSYVIYCDSDIASGADSSTTADVQTLKDCIDICTAYTIADPDLPCLAAVLAGTTCYTKSSQGTGPFTSAVHSLGLLILPPASSSSVSLSTTNPVSTSITPTASAVFPVCPQDNDATYTSNQSSFVVYCDSDIASDGTSSSTSDVSSLKECLDICAVYTVNNPTQPCLAAVYTDGTCLTKSTQSTGPFNSVGSIVGLAVLATTSSISSQVSTTLTSSASPSATSSFPNCPGADGLIYTTGEDSYVVYCDSDVQSGFNDVTTENIASLSACFDLCSAYSIQTPESPCLAAALTGTTCYSRLTQGSGPSTSLGYSLGLLVLPFTACQQKGLIYDVFTTGPGAPQLQDDSYAPDQPTGFDPAKYDGDAADYLFSGVAEDINWSTEDYSPQPAQYDGSLAYLPGKTFPFKTGNTVIVYHGYLPSLEGGTYTLTVRSPDDYGYIWTGNSAFSTAWKLSNAASTVTLTVAEKSYTPVTILMANLGSRGVLQIDITGTDGALKTDTTGFFVQPSCRVGGHFNSPPTGATPSQGPPPDKAPLPQPTCDGISGMAYDVFVTSLDAPQVYSPDTYGPDVPGQFDPSVYDGDVLDYLFSGFATNVNFRTYDFAPQPPSGRDAFAILPGKNFAFQTTNTVIVFRGYFLAPIDGTYTFQFSQFTDNIAYIWTGETAYTGWTKENSVASQAAYADTSRGTYSFVADGGSYTPFTILLSNFGGPGLIDLRVTNPNGVTQIGTAGYFVPPVCRTDGNRFNSPPAGVYANQGPPPQRFLVPQPDCTGVTGLIYDVFVTGPDAPQEYSPDTYGPNMPGGFDPATYDGDATDYLFSGTADNINWSTYTYDPQPPSGGGAFAFLPGKSFALQTTNIVVVYRGYFLAPTAGTYTLAFGQFTDNIGYFWLNEAAYTGWNKQNFAATQDITGGTNQNQFTFTAVAGSYTPITIMLVNFGGGGTLQFYVTKPDGTTLSNTSGFFAPPVCRRDPQKFNSPPAGATPSQGPPPQKFLVPEDTAQPDCGGQTGMIYDVFVTGPNAPQVYSPDTYGPNMPGGFDPSTYDSDSSDYLFSGSADNINWSTGDYSPQPPSGDGAFAILPGKDFAFQTTNTVVVYHGYFYASVAGNYGLQFGQFTDNIGYLWAGDVAFRGWTKQNLVATQVGYGDTSRGSYSFAAEADSYTAFTVLVVNFGGPGVLDLKITDRDGSQRSDTTGFFVPPACRRDGNKFNSPPAGATPSQGPPPARFLVTQPDCAGASGMVYDVYAMATLDAQGSNPATYVGNSRDYLFSGMAQNINWRTADFSPQPATGEYSYAILPNKDFVINTAYTVTIYHGYFHASVAGTYQIQFGGAIDDQAYLYARNKAFAGWTTQNYDAMREINASGDQASYSITVGEDSYIPITIVFINNSGPGTFQVSIIDRDGSIRIDTTGFFVPPSCRQDGSRFNSPPSGATPSQGPPPEQYLAPQPDCNGATGLAYDVFDSSTQAFSASRFYNDATDYLLSGLAEDVHWSTYEYFPQPDGLSVAVLPGKQYAMKTAETVIMYHGYFHTTVPDTYTIQISGVDDIAYLWADNTAFMGYNEQNFAAAQDISGTNSQSTFSIIATADSYTPITIVLYNAGGPGSIQIDIIDSNGDIHTGTSGYFVPPTCRRDGYKFKSPPDGVTPSQVPPSRYFRTDCNEASGMVYDVFNVQGGAFNAGTYDGDSSDYLFSGLASNVYWNSNDYKPQPDLSDSFTVLPGKNYALSMAGRVVVYHGYFYARLAGTYGLQLANVDDVAYIWSKANAFTSYNGDNYDAVLLIGGSSTSSRYTFTMNADSYTPITIMIYNNQGPGSIQVQVIDYDNSVSDSTAGYFTPPSCLVDGYKFNSPPSMAAANQGPPPGEGIPI